MGLKKKMTMMMMKTIASRQHNNFMLCSICTCTKLCLLPLPLSLCLFFILFPSPTQLKWLFHVLHNFASLSRAAADAERSVHDALTHKMAYKSLPPFLIIPSPSLHHLALSARHMHMQSMLSYLSGTSSSRVSLHGSLLLPQRPLFMKFMPLTGTC